MPLQDYLTRPITWTSAFEMGEAEIDRQHRHFIDQVNAITEAVQSGAGRESLMQSMTEMIDDAYAHFAYEEAILARIGFSDGGEHAAEHRRLAGKLSDLARRIRLTKERDAALSVVDELRLLLLEHLLYYDLRYKSDLMRARGR